MPADRPIVIVLAAVIEREGKLLVTRRLEGTHLSGYWEFPGGKCEPGEDHETCLRRELLEELNVGCEVGDEMLVTEHAYPTRSVRLHFRWCRISGEPTAVLGQEMRWIRRDELGELQFPDADRELIDLLMRSTSTVTDRP